jgi:hypothetical protein
MYFKQVIHRWTTTLQSNLGSDIVESIKTYPDIQPGIVRRPA